MVVSEGLWMGKDEKRDSVKRQEQEQDDLGAWLHAEKDCHVGINSYGAMRPYEHHNPICWSFAVYSWLSSRLLPATSCLPFIPNTCVSYHSALGDQSYFVCPIGSCSQHSYSRALVANLAA